MAWDGVHKGDYGWRGTIVFQQDGTALDISSYTTLQFILLKPDGSEDTKTAGFATDGTDGVIEYTFVSGDIDQAGKWKVQGRIAKAGTQLTTDYHTFHVHLPLPDVAVSGTNVASYATTAALTAHTASTSNPHSVTAAQAGALAIANNLSDLDTAATARTNLGLGTMAVETATDYAAVANNLSDLASAATARANLGIGPRSAYVVAASDAPATWIALADYTCDGTADESEINTALAAVDTVLLSPGTFNVANTISIGVGQSLKGAGQEQTVLDVSGSNDVIQIASGVIGTAVHATVEGMSIELPDATSGDGIVTVARQSVGTTLRDLNFTGGDGSCWAITLAGSTRFEVSNVYMYVACNGLRAIADAASSGVLMGNGLVQHVHVSLWSDNTTGFYTVGRADAGLILCSFHRCEALARGGASGTTGFHLGDYSNYITLIQPDAENHALGYKLGDAGAGGGNFTIIEPTAFGCTTDIEDNTSTAVVPNIVGGFGHFGDYQGFRRKLPKTLSITADRTLSVTDADRVMNTNGATASTTYTLTLPAANNDYSYRYTISNTQATANAVVIAFALGDAGDRIVDTTGSLKTSITSGGAEGDTLTLYNVNFKYWIVENKIGTWS